MSLNFIPRLKRALMRRLIPRDSHSSLRLWLTGPFEDQKPVLVNEFNREPVLVLAPHPDDEVIGPAGTLRRHVLAGAPVSVAILTDGSQGGDNRDGGLVERRKKESQAAAKIIGTQAPLFFDQPDSVLAETPALLARLEELFSEHDYETIYLPALTDGHGDHWAANRILAALLPRLPEKTQQRLRIRGYEIWSPTFSNCQVDISATVEVKRQALDCFPSQTGADDYAGAALGLNRYRALQHLHGHGYVEAFLQLNVAEFHQLFGAASAASAAR